MVGAFSPNFPCSNNAMSSSEFVPGNAVREAVVPLTVVNVVVLGAIIHQATIWAPIGACPGTQKACPRDTTLATFSSRHVLHMQGWNFSVQSRSCSTWQNTHSHWHTPQGHMEDAIFRLHRNPQPNLGHFAATWQSAKMKRVGIFNFSKINATQLKSWRLAFIHDARFYATRSTKLAKLQFSNRKNMRPNCKNR